MGASNPVRTIHSLPPCAIVHKLTINPHQLDRLVGLAMLIIASTVFAYYTVWTLLMVWSPLLISHGTKPFRYRNEQGTRT